jgi:SAM-dependent methyltransferase
MASQSGRSLPLIYQPFDPHDRGHWRDRGSAFDFMWSTLGEQQEHTRRLLDFGPGDGWPSLIVAPYAGAVVGVDGSMRRVQVCAENAARLGIDNTRFLYVPPGEPLPFPDDHFDGIMAASSLEQTPNPRATLQELYRVLRPGGRLRFGYEALNRYRGGQEQDIWLSATDGERSRLIIFDRDPDAECARQHALIFRLPIDALKQALWPQDKPAFETLEVQRLRELRSVIDEAKVCTLIHPSGATWACWLKEIGFHPLEASGGYGRHSGARFARRLFDQLATRERPHDRSGIDATLRPIVRIVVGMAAPLDTDPMLTAVK